MDTFAFDWLIDRVAKYGWKLKTMKGQQRVFMGPRVPLVVVEVVNKRVHKRWVDVFDECTREIFNESIYDIQKGDA